VAYFPPEIKRFRFPSFLLSSPYLRGFRLEMTFTSFHGSCWSALYLTAVSPPPRSVLEVGFFNSFPVPFHFPVMLSFSSIRPFCASFLSKRQSFYVWLMGFFFPSSLVCFCYFGDFLRFAAFCRAFSVPSFPKFRHQL